MGPLLYKKRIGETDYSVRAIPIGGYVAMAGEEQLPEGYQGREVPRNKILANKPAYQRLIVLLAGVTMNMLLAIAIFTAVFAVNGEYTTTTAPFVESVVAGSPADLAGLKEGDVFVQAVVKNEKTVQISDAVDMQLIYAMNTNADPIELTIRRDGEFLTIPVTPTYNDETKAFQIGVMINSVVTRHTTPANSFIHALRYTGVMLKSVAKALKNIWRPHILKSMSGPIGILTMTGDATASGVSSYLLWIGIISLNIGAFNLLPLPILDGGQALILLLETIIRKELSFEHKQKIALVCWGLLIMFIVFVSIQDILRVL